MTNTERECRFAWSLARLAADTRAHLEQVLGRKLETSSLKMGTDRLVPSRPFLRAALKCAPAIEEELKAAIKAALTEAVE